MEALDGSASEPAVLEVPHVLEDHPVLAHEDDLHEIRDDEGRNDDLDTLRLDVRPQVLHPIGDMRVVADRLGHLSIAAVAQELDVLGVVARIGNPAFAGLDPVLTRLLDRGGYADVVEFVVHQPILTTLPVRADCSAARVASSAAVASSGVPMVTVPPE